MKNPLHNDDDFESFLHKQVADHRIYPSDQLWRSIQKELHGEGRWPALTYISIFIIAALSVCTMMVKPEDRLHKNIIVYPTVKEEITAAEKSSGGSHNTVAAAPIQYAYAERMTEQTMQSVSDVIIARTEKLNAAGQSMNLTKQSLLTVENKTKDEQLNSAQPVAKANTVARQPESSQKTAVTVTKNTTPEDKITEPSSILQFAAAKPASRYFSTIGLMKLSDLKKSSDKSSSSILYNKEEIWRKYPLTNGSDLWRKKLSKLSFQFYITPSVSYRRLNDAQGKSARSYTALPRTSNYQLDVNRVVEHQAQMGAEVGFAMGYKLTSTLTAKGGFQFNVRQYGIKAYTIPVAQNLSDAAISNAPGASSENPDEVAVDNAYFTSANNTDLSKPVVLSNRYYELSVPIGLDWRILTASNGRLTVNTAISLQPTYTFDKEPFVITTDYKNYSDGASIMHNWNLNSNVETYVSYQMGAFRWQLGPQFRYQHFSTYSNAYPIREHLLDYGFKIGFTKSLD